MSKVIFLDYDGVLNNQDYLCLSDYPIKREIKGYEADFDPYRVNLLKQACDSTDAVVVVMSSWRFNKDAREYLMKRGIPIIGVTPYLENDNRGVEVQQWLDEHSAVEKYVLLDDDKSGYTEEQLKHLVYTSNGVNGLGLEPSDVEKITKLLGEGDSYEVK